MTITNSLAVNIRANKDNPLVDVVADHFDGLRKRSDEGIEPLEYYKQNLYFVTATFFPFTVGINGGPASKDGVPSGYRPSALSDFGVSFLRINKQLLGSNLKRKKHVQPQAWMFVDFDGTREGSNEKQGIHLHGLLMAHPSKREGFMTLARISDTFKTVNMRRLLIEPFDPSRVKQLDDRSYESDPLKRCISYASKGARKHYGEEHGSLWTVFPTSSAVGCQSQTQRAMCSLVRDVINTECKQIESSSRSAWLHPRPTIQVRNDESFGMLRHKLKLVGLEDQFPDLLKHAEAMCTKIKTL